MSDESARDPGAYQHGFGDDEPTASWGENTSGPMPTWGTSGSSPAGTPPNGAASGTPDTRQQGTQQGSYPPPDYGQPSGPYTPRPPYGQTPHEAQPSYSQNTYTSQPPQGWSSGQQPAAQPAWNAPSPSAPQYAYAPPATAPYGSPTQPGSPTVVPPYAHWGKRVGAALIDAAILIPLEVLAAVAAPRYVHYTDTGATRQTGGSMVILALLYVLMLIATLMNVCFLQGRTGQSLGKRVLNIYLVSEQTGRPLGPFRCFVRQLAHFLDSICCYVGFLWPLWDSKRQTFADKVMSCIVTTVKPR